MAKPKLPAWKQFEIAVAEFLKALEPSATLRPDAKLPDKHTGKLRQRDIWIEVNFGNFIPINILVSCKRYRRLLHEGDIDTFNGELHSSSAHKGILYSYSGFRKDAVAKAKALGICCCRLYSNQPADIPESLYLGSQYCCHPQISITLRGDYIQWGLQTWNDLWTASAGGGKETVLQIIEHEFRLKEQESILNMENQRDLFPSDWASMLRIEEPNAEREPLEVTIDGRWKFFAAEMEATLLNGSYSLTTNQFVGTQHYAWIDVKGTTPGPAWKALDARPESPKPPCMTAVRNGGNASGLVEILGPLPIGSYPAK